MRIFLPARVDGVGPRLHIEFSDTEEGDGVWVWTPNASGSSIMYKTSKLEWAKLLRAGSALLLEDISNEDGT